MSRIGLVLPDLEAGGAQRVMLQLARQFAIRGHRVDLVLLRAFGPLLSEIPEGVTLVDLGARTLGVGKLGFSISSLRRLVLWIRSARPQAMLSSITGANLLTVVARKIAGEPIRLVIRHTGSLQGPLGRIRLSLMRHLYPRADAVVALSTVMATSLVETVRVPINNVRCITNPVDVIQLRELGRMSVDHPWFAEDAPPVIISIGRLVPEKDYPTLLRAFALLTKEFACRLLILGEGPERSALERLILSLGIADRVQLFGFDPNPWRWLTRSQLFVLSSRSEGMPNSALEARTLGIPIVATEYDASSHEIGDRAMRFVPVGDVTALSAAMNVSLRARRETTTIPEDFGDPVSDYLRLLIEEAH